MELEVRAVGGIESCFVSLPLPLIHALQSTAGGILPPVLALELRSRDGNCWRVAWSGSGSRSPALEVSKNFAECIALSDGTNVYVKVLPNLPRAVLVTIEPNDESDWEILELNSEVAEEAILKQRESLRRLRKQLQARPKKQNVPSSTALSSARGFHKNR